MVAWASWYPTVLPELLGCPSIVVDAFLRDAAIELCTDTGVYVGELPAINVVASTAAYTLATGDAAVEAFMVLRAWYKGAVIPPAPLDALDKTLTRWQDELADAPLGFTQTQYDKIQLVPTPLNSYTGALTVRAVLRPTRTAAAIVDHIGNRFYTAIAEGALAQLQAMENKPWSNASGAARHKAAFLAEKTSANILADRSYTRDALHVTQRPAA